MGRVGRLHLELAASAQAAIYDQQGPHYGALTIPYVVVEAERVIQNAVPRMPDDQAFHREVIDDMRTWALGIP